MLHRFNQCVIAIFVFYLNGFSQQPVTFSIQAHQDDWQLFMCNAIITDINSGKKIVFITLTAGDAGNGTGAYGSSTPYYVTRERGAIQSAKFIADLPGGIPALIPTVTTVNINGHNMAKYVYKNTVNYFLRLPDGGGNGAGNPITGFKSLQRLKTGAITSISAIDGSTTYFGWTDLRQTLSQIVLAEKSAGRATWVYTGGLGASNSGDHSDHIHSSTAIQEAVASYLWVGINEFVNYSSSGYPVNLSVPQQADAAGTFACYILSLNAAQYEGHFDDGHKSWLPMDVSTVKRNPVGATPFASTAPVMDAASVSIISATAGTGKNNDVFELIVNASETGNLQIEVFNSSNSKIYTNTIQVMEKTSVIIPISKSSLISNSCVVLVTLNNKYFERKELTIN